MYACVSCVCPIALRGQKRALGLELQTVVSCHMGAGSWDPLEEQPVFLMMEPLLLLECS